MVEWFRHTGWWDTVLLPTANSTISFSNTKGNQWGPADLWVPPGNWHSVKAKMRQEHRQDKKKGKCDASMCLSLCAHTGICMSVSGWNFILNYSKCTMGIPKPEMGFILIRLKRLRESRSWPVLFSGVNEIKGSSKMNHLIQYQYCGDRTRRWITSTYSSEAESSGTTDGERDRKLKNKRIVEGKKESRNCLHWRHKCGNIKKVYV